MGYSEALEVKYRLASWVLTDYAQQAFALIASQMAYTKGNAETSNLTLLLGSLFQRACMFSDPYFCARDIMDLLESTSSNMPDWTFRQEVLPAPEGLIWFARPASVNTAEPTVVLRGLAWAIYYDGDTDPDAGPDVRRMHYHHFDAKGLPPSVKKITPFLVLYYLFTRNGSNSMVVPAQVLEWESGQSFMEVANEFSGMGPEGEPMWRELDEYAVRFFAAFCTFIEQKIFVHSSERADRATRRRVDGLAAKMQVVTEELVRVIALRKRVYPQNASHAAEEAVEWSCRWLVRGHWREQWYPSLGIHQPKWILPYVKGPEDKPLRPPRATVFAVVR